jgi:hypothetical protein
MRGASGRACRTEKIRGAAGGANGESANGNGLGVPRDADRDVGRDDPSDSKLPAACRRADHPPMAARTRSAAVARPSPEAHAARLLRWVSEANCSGGVVLAMDLERIYPVMAEQLEWQAYPWQRVATCLRQLTGGGKPYRRVDGHRRRVYFVRSASP